MTNPVLARIAGEVEAARQDGTLKLLKTMETPIGAEVDLKEAGHVILMSSNDYLGLSNHPEIVESAKQALLKYGASTASVRFICGTQTIHQELEEALADLHGTEAALTYSSCWAANTGLMPIIAGPGDVLISDELNHASIIDGCRASAKNVVRTVYKHSDMASLKAKLEEHRDAPGRIIVTDGVFSMEGDIAPLPEIVALAEEFDALIVLDDSHGLGVLGPNGLGTADHFGVLDKIDIFTGTLGKALGAGTGGFVAGPKAVRELLIHKSRPHLFSNALPASVAGAAIKSVELLKTHPEWARDTIEKAQYFRELLQRHGLKALDGDSAVVPVIIGETAAAIALSSKLLKDGIFVTGFGFPVVPEGEARLRFQISHAHSREQLEKVAQAVANAIGG
ncbi:aminotransferase class I/II-fold pyridoxal phosphate-dependent enzyme [Aestuariispira insulae]|uniref:5-aminolevulinate synthase n=1 Tax=Aestuariispira insulae TaxID=1461337 RepID=A0A3D9HXM1_9PROT|nr:aminotransferase class I/II-fold pyridoxal phosphate-dependent enzyme [Aestuariispira insulae]RED54253.1 2-amino-3-ketobutyrate coenzyme A ligase [Aestuariispira insulae]